MTENTDLDLQEMKEIIDDFLVEADELIHSLDNNLVKLETAPADLGLLNEIFRAAHTIKGTSSFLGFEQVTNLTHKMEDVLNRLRKGEMVVTPEIMDLLLESLDMLKVLLNDVREGNREEHDLSGLLAKLSAAYAGEAAQATATKAGPSPVEIETKPDAESMAQEPAEEGSGTAEAAIKTPDAKTPTARRSGGEQTIRVDVDRLDTLMNLMGELVLSRNSLVQTVNRLTTEHEGEYALEKLNQSSATVNFITTELQMAVMKMRMQPIGKVFNKFPRLVRDLARDSGKKIELAISGETTELDKSVIEEIGDPLVHIIRNSCDHGIELPDERIAAGKPEQGTIKMSADQEGSHIIIKIEDDGRGLDAGAIRAKAVERGLVSQADVDKMSDRDIFSYIFEPGFSTAKKVTDVSGRGVGMDVVRTNIEKLNGMVELGSRRGAGTTIMIKLPLTLAIIQGLLVECDKDVFILPLSSVHETVKTEGAEIYYVNQRPVFRLRDQIIPIINLVEVLNVKKAAFILTEKPYIVVVGLADKKLGIIVDRFLGQEEVVIKSLGTYLGNTEGISGATILGDGRIRLIVDLIGLFGIARKLS